MQCGASRNSQRARIYGVRRRVVDKERDLERAPPWRRQCRQDLVEDILEQIAEPDVSKTALGLCRARGEDARSQRARLLDARKPQGGFPDAGFALEHECGGTTRLSADEGLDGGEFHLPADNLERHLS